MLGIRGVPIPGFGFGGACGIGFGFGWGFFLYGLGAPVYTIRSILRIDDRIMDRAIEKLRLEREQGLRPPFKYDVERDSGFPDPILDRIIRQIQKRHVNKKIRRPEMRLKL